jgi:hypothetical protein
MAAGEPIVSQASTPEYEDGHTRVFGERGVQRGRWYVDPKTGDLRDTPPAWTETDSQRVPVVTDRYMEGVCATDGVDIGSRRKRRAYMRENGLVDHDDCKGMFAEARKERLKIRAGDHDHRERREQLGRALYEARSRKR